MGSYFERNVAPIGPQWQDRLTAAVSVLGNGTVERFEVPPIAVLTD